MLLMQISIIGTGFIGGTLGRALSGSGHEVTFGARRTSIDHVEGQAANVVSIGEAIDASDVVILAIPGQAVAELGKDYGDALAGKLVIDATNRMGQAVVNGRADLPSNIRYARAFNTLGGENFADPSFRDGTADLFFSAPAADRAVVEEIISGVGLGPVYAGEDHEALIDALFVLWIELAMTQGRGRHLALKLLQD